MNRQGKRLGPDGYLYLSVDASGSSVAMLNYQSKVSKKARKLASGAAILNAKGKFLLKPQKEEITAFFGGVATMVKSEGEEIVRSYYDTKGKMRFSESDLPGYFLYGDPKFSEGLATILISYAKGDPQKQSRSSYAGVVDMGGKLVFSNREWRSVTQFESGLAFALGHDRLYWPIDRRGKVLSQAGFSYVFTNSARFNYDLLQDGIALAIQGKEVVALDSNGVVKWRNPMMVNGYRWLCRNGDVVYFVDGEGYDLPEYYGFWNTRTGVFSEPNYQQLDYALGEEPAMVGLRSDHFVLLDDAGIEVWQQDEQIAKLPRPQNLDHQLGPIFDFEGKADVSVLEFDEDWEMKSMEVGLMQIEEGKQFVPDAVSIFVADSAQADLMTRSVDWQVALVNTRTDSLALEVHYTNPFAFLQAQDSAGNWQNISGLRFQPRGPDIESYKMPPGYALWAIIPAMEGGFPTKLRIAWALTSNDMKDGKYILSKEFPGSINPGQFHGADCTLFMGFPRLD
ncbi:MAG: hypothetical protein U0176_17655 [Bacteroidia bacterium]